MPPQTKPIISKLEDMVCWNCIYSVYKGQDAEKTPYSCHEIENRPTGFFGEEAQTHFCSKGKWFTGRRYTSDFESELNLEDYDDTYYGIVRAQMFPDAVSLAEEHRVRQEIMAELEVLMDYKNSGMHFVYDKAKFIQNRLNLLWGEQE